MNLELRGSYNNGFYAFLDATSYDLIIGYTNDDKYIELIDRINIGNGYSISGVAYNETQYRPIYCLEYNRVKYKDNLFNKVNMMFTFTRNIKGIEIEEDEVIYIILD